MDKNKARKMYELADRLSKVDTSKLNEQQLVEHTGMIKRLGEELKAMREGAAAQFSPEMHDRIKNATPQELSSMAYELGGDAIHAKSELELLKKAQAELKGMAEARDTGNDIDDIVEDYLDYLEKHNALDFPTREEEKASIMADIESGALHPDELEYAMSGNNDMNEAPISRPGQEAGDVMDYSMAIRGTPRMAAELNVDPVQLKTSIANVSRGNKQPQYLRVIAQAFMNLLKNSDDQSIQRFANLVKSGNPKESAGNIAEANAFVDAMRQVKKGEKFTVGGKEHTKTTNFGDDKKVDEAISTEAYDRLKRVFDFSNFKG